MQGRNCLLQRPLAAHCSSPTCSCSQNSDHLLGQLDAHRKRHLLEKPEWVFCPDGLVPTGFASPVVNTEIRCCSRRSLSPLSMSSFKSPSSHEDSRGASAFTADGSAKMNCCVVLDTEGKACPGDDGTRVTQSEAPAAVCQALTSEEEQQDTTTAATTNVTSFGEELHLDELKEDAGMAYKMFSKNCEVL